MSTFGRRLDFRTKAHWSYFAYYLHRVSGLLLACFLPMHFFVLSRSLYGEAQLAQYLAFTDQPIFKFGEWGLVTLLALHLIGGTRLLVIEFGIWKGLRKAWIQITLLGSLICGALFLILSR
jgi:fumarate reductase subunit D